jgi:hypothetical protein
MPATTKADPVGEIRETPYGLRLFSIPEDSRTPRSSMGALRLLAMPNGDVRWEKVEED